MRVQKVIKPGKKWPIIVLVASGLTVVVALLVLLGWFWLRERPRAGLIIVTYPGEVDIYIDGSLKGVSPLRLDMEPGDCLVTLKKEHYVTWEGEVSVVKDEYTRLEKQLQFLPYTVLFTGGKRLLSWTEDSEGIYCFYVTDTGDQLARMRLDGNEEVKINTGFKEMGIHGLAWSRDQKRLLAWGYIRDEQDRAHSYSGLVVSDLEGNIRPIAREREPGGGILAASWSHTEREIAYLQAVVEPSQDMYPRIVGTELWVVDSHGQNAKKAFSFDRNDEAHRVHWSSQGKLLVQGSTTTFLFETSDGEVVQSSTISDTVASLWSSDGEYIAYQRLEDNETSSLWVDDVSGNYSTQLVTDIISQFQWVPGRASLIYFTYDPELHASACWAIDVEAGERTLLADKSIITQRVGDFAISPDGKRIAFEGEDGNIWLLTLSE